MEVTLTIVGIRNYCNRGEDGYPELFARLPKGSIVYLRKEPTGSQYPGSVSVLDDNNKKIGNISKTERRFIELEIPEGEMLPVTISGHSKEHNCMYVTAENTKGFNKPYIRDITLIEGETVLATTDYDQKIQQLTSMMKTKIKMLKDNKVSNTDSLLNTARQYVSYCCESLDGETSFSRQDFLIDLRNLSKSYPELNDVYSEIHEKHKDINRKFGDINTRVYLDQYNRIKDKAFSTEGRSQSQMDDYIEKLKFAHCGMLTKEVVDAEIARLSGLLANEMMKSYVENLESSERFATALYSLNYSWKGMYRLYTRMIRLEFLKSLSADNMSINSENHETQSISQMSDLLKQIENFIKRQKEAFKEVEDKPTSIIVNSVSISNLSLQQQDLNFNAPIGQQIAHVDKIEAHFDKDMKMEIAGAEEVAGMPSSEATPKDDDVTNRDTIPACELFRFIHPEVTDYEERVQIHNEVKNLVSNNTIPNICAYLNEMAAKRRILQPIETKNALKELRRMGMPGEDAQGFGEKNFQKYYRK